MKVTALVFDMDDVLYDDTLWHRWLLQLLARFDLHTTYHIFFRAWQRDYLGEVYRGRRDFWEALHSYLRSAGLKPGQADEVLAAAQSKRRTLFNGARPLPGVLATTARLQSFGVPLAVLCNTPWNGDKTHELLERLGLAARFDPVICSCDVGHAKPDKQMYDLAISQLGCTVSHTAFVGHDARELAAAGALGMPTIAINADDDAQADLVLDRFDQLLTQVSFRTKRLLAG